MVGADDVVLSIIIVSTISNMVVDIFGEVLLEYGVYYTKKYVPDFSIPGFDGFDNASAATDGSLATLIDQLSQTPQFIDKLSVEQLELLNTVLVSMQVAG